jgi:hypothetical protein
LQAVVFRLLVLECLGWRNGVDWKRNQYGGRS